MVYEKRLIEISESGSELYDYSEKSLVVFNVPSDKISIFQDFKSNSGFTKDSNGYPKFHGFMCAKINSKLLEVIDKHFGLEWRSEVILPEKITYEKKEYIKKENNNSSQATIVKNDIIKPIPDIFSLTLQLGSDLSQLKELKMMEVNKDEVIIAGLSNDVDEKLKDYDEYKEILFLSYEDKKVVYISYTD